MITCWEYIHDPKPSISRIQNLKTGALQKSERMIRLYRGLVIETPLFSINLALGRDPALSTCGIFETGSF
jgi:hypothetical protein